MKRTMVVPFLAALLASGACSKKKEETKSETSGKTAEATSGDTAGALDSSGPVAKSEAPAAQTDKANALWALAPAESKLGMVAVPGAGLRLHGMGMEILRVLEARPLGAKLVAELREKAKQDEVNPFDPNSFKAIGLDLNLGAAMFMVKEKQGFAILPVSDRAAFLKFSEGSTKTVDGLEVDQLEDDFFCVQKERYLCASSPADLKGFGSSVNGALAKRVAELPAQYRGDAEMVVDIAAMAAMEGEDFDKEFYDYFADPQLGILALRFGNGAFSARGWMQAKPVGVLAEAGSVSSALAAAAAKQNPTGLFHLRLPSSLWTKSLPAEDQVLPGGLSLKKDVIGNLTGEFIGFTPASSSLWGTIALGLNDPTPFKTLLNMGCGMAGALGEGLKVTPGDGTCSARVDFSKLPMPDPSVAAMFPEPLEVKVEVKKEQLAITIGSVTPVNSKHAMGALGSDLVKNPWSFSLWAEGISIANGFKVPWDQLDALPAEASEGLKLGLWTLAHVYELGWAGAIRDDGVHAVMQVATYAGDPAPAYKDYQAAVLASLSGDAKAQFASLATKHPGTMAGAQGGAGGAVIVAGVVGSLAAVAIPAFMKYIEKSKEAAEVIDLRDTTPGFKK